MIQGLSPNLNDAVDGNLPPGYEREVFVIHDQDSGEWIEEHLDELDMK